MKNHQLNNVMVLCTFSNKERLASFFNNHKMSDTIVLATDLAVGNYYGLYDGKFTETGRYSNDDKAMESVVNYYDLDQAINFYGMNPVTIHMKDIDTTKTFPRVMWLKDNDESVDSYRKAVVIAFARNKYICWSGYSINTSNGELLTNNNHYPIDDWNTMSFDQAIEEDELIVLSREDIAKLANTTIDKLKII
jgi:hypothetical protein